MNIQIQHGQRLDQFLKDTAYVNALSELGGDAGAFTAGLYANQCCEAYMTERVLAANTKCSLEQELEIALTRRKMQEAILETKSMSYMDALDQCAEQGITLD